EVSFPSRLQTIGDDAFSGCFSLLEVSLPEGLQTIGDDAFSGCSSLTEVSLPAGLQTLGDRAFYGCKSLLNFGVAKGNANFRSVDGVLFSADGKKLLKYPCGRQKTEYVVPDGVVEIAKSAFYKCESLKEVSLPEGLQTIDSWAFFGCSSLRKVSFPSGLQTIGEEAFCDCKSLGNVSLPCVKIGKNAFGRSLPAPGDPFYWAERGGVYADWGNPFF
ncbi:MAG: leucine-rich repeat domain-containing protein, partial [Thermoguttaceae bacterium]|nr:leucine-rich repeat domain-containing protein [Thermoguttaceae bacterium]